MVVAVAWAIGGRVSRPTRAVNCKRAALAATKLNRHPTFLSCKRATRRWAQSKGELEALRGR